MGNSLACERIFIPLSGKDFFGIAEQLSQVIIFWANLTFSLAAGRSGGRLDTGSGTGKPRESRPLGDEISHIAPFLLHSLANPQISLTFLPVIGRALERPRYVDSFCSWKK